MAVNKDIETGDVIGLDIGDARIGVARINMIAKIAEPLDPIIVKSVEPFSAIMAVVKEYSASCVVLGLPRGLDGQETAQTQSVRSFALKLKEKVNVPVYMIDEAGTSKEAKENADSYKSSSVDSIAATIILEDFINYSDKQELRI